VRELDPMSTGLLETDILGNAKFEMGKKKQGWLDGGRFLKTCDEGEETELQRAPRKAHGQFGYDEMGRSLVRCPEQSSKEEETCILSAGWPNPEKLTSKTWVLRRKRTRWEDGGLEDHQLFKED